MRNTRLLLPLVVLSAFFALKTAAQQTTDCAKIQQNLQNTLLNSKSVRYYYLSLSKYVQVYSETDSASHRHVSYNDMHGDNYGIIWADEAVRFKTGKEKWRDKVPADIQYAPWLDSIHTITQILATPFEHCTLIKEADIAGTAYAVFDLTRPTDSIRLWQNLATQKIEKIQGNSLKNAFHFECAFDLPIDIKVPATASDENDKFVLRFFPPEYYLYENLDGNEPVYAIADEMPVFEGGERNIFATLFTNINYPASAKESNIQGIVVWSFVIEKNGKMSNYRLLRGIQKACDAEALRVIKLFEGKWTAASFNGKKVRYNFVMPIKFKLE